MLQGKSISKFYGRTTALSKLNIEIYRGEIRSLLGPNGAGKTTAFSILTGVERPSRGEVMLDGEDITSWNICDRSRRGISYLPQESSLFRRLSVKENLLLVLEGSSFDSKDRGEVAGSFLARLDIKELAHSKPYELSAGQKRKVEIGRALATSPTFLLLDEPFSGIDPLSVEELQNILNSLRREDNIGLAITDHKVRETLSVADYNYLINDGELVAEGVTEEILSDPEVRRVYLGQKFTMNSR